MKHQLGPRIALLIALLAAGFARLIGLTRDSLWNDELGSLQLAQGGPLDAEFWTRLVKDVHPPGYEVLLWAWIQLFGDSELSVRGSSAVAGVLGVAATYRLGAQLYGRWAGASAAMLSASSPLLIEYSQEVRASSLNYLFGALLASSLLGLVGAESPRSRGAFWQRVGGCSVVAAATAYMHYLGLVVAVGLFMLAAGYVLIAERCAVHSLLAAFGLFVVLVLPWAATGLIADLTQGGLTWLRPPSLTRFLEFPTTVMPTFALLMAIFASLACSVGADGTKTVGITAPSNNVLTPTIAAIGCAAWFLGLVGAVYLKSIWSAPMFAPRYLLGAVPPVFVALGGSLHSRSQARPVLRLAVSMVIAACVYCGLVADSSPYAPLKKQPFRELTAQAIGILERSNDAHVYSLAFGETFYFDYYFRQLGSDHRVTRGSSSAAKVDNWVRAALSEPGGKAIVLAGHIPIPRSILVSWQRDFAMEYKRLEPKTALVTLRKRDR